MRGRPSQKLFRKQSDKERVHFSNFGRPKDAIRKKKKVTDEDKKEKIGQHEDLSFCVMNVNSMHSAEKESLVKLGIAESRADVIVLTETRLGEVESKQFQMPGYNVIAQKDRKRGAGGIMVLTKINLKVREAEAVDIIEEIQVAHFKFQDLPVIGIYRSPTILARSSREHHGSLIDYLNRKIQEHGGSPYVITGDFNLGDLASYDFNPPHLKPVEDGQEQSVAQMWLNGSTRMTLNSM